MPKLNSAKAAEVKKAGEEGAFPLFPIGLTKVKLMDVTTGTSRGGDPMWTWEFQFVEFLEDWQPEPGTDPDSAKAKHPNDRFVGKTIRYFTVIKDTTLWDLDRVFASFDADPDTDTDDLLGEEIVVVMDQSIATGGRSKGELQSEITRFYTLKDGIEAANQIKASSGVSPAKAAKTTKKVAPKADSAQPDF